MRVAAGGVKLTARTQRLRLRSPLRTAFGELAERELIEVGLTGADGVTGHGEAAPLEPYDGVSVARVRDALERYEQVLDGGRGAKRRRRAGGGALLDACREADDLPQALAAIDLALWDRAGKRAGRPVAELLSGDPASDGAGQRDARRHRPRGRRRAGATRRWRRLSSASR